MEKGRLVDVDALLLSQFREIASILCNRLKLDGFFFHDMNHSILGADAARTMSLCAGLSPEKLAFALKRASDVEMVRIAVSSDAGGEADCFHINI